MTLTTQQVDIGSVANDGTGNSLRDAFSITNNNISLITSYINTNVIPVMAASRPMTFGAVLPPMLFGATDSATELTGSGLSVTGQISGATLSLSGNANIQNLGVAHDASLLGNLMVNGNSIINGSLIVHGNITTVTQSEYVVTNPTISIGGAQGAALSVNDGLDRGINYYWFDTVQKEGFIGVKNSTNELIFVPDISTGLLGNASLNNITANVISTGTSIFNTLEVTTINGGNNNSNLTVNGNIHLAPGQTIYVDGSPVATSNLSFQGGPVPHITHFNDRTDSTAFNNGAVIVDGGVGIFGNLNVGGTFSANNFNVKSFTGTLLTSDQPNITSVGNLDSLMVRGNAAIGAINTNQFTAIDIHSKTISATDGFTGNLLTSNQPNITSVGTLSSLNVSGPVTAGKFIGSFTGTIDGNVTGSASTVTNSKQLGIQQVGTLTSLNVAGTTFANTITATGTISTTGNITGNSLTGTLQTSTQPNLTSIGPLTSLTVSGPAIFNDKLVAASGISTVGAGTQNIGTPTNRFGTIYVQKINFSDNTSQGTAIDVPDLTAVQTNIVPASNKTQSIGSPTRWWNTVYASNFSGVAARVSNGDLAEMYQTDGQYSSGTVVVFGGQKEIALTGVRGDPSVAGVVSTAPAYLMNQDQTSSLPIALRGKVPVNVIGPVHKGDLLITSYISGYAESVGKDASYGPAIFAKSLVEDLNSNPRSIYAVII
jgi:hypothetical protein